jgi:hypothetical protein
MFIAQIDPRCNDTRREDPFRDLERYFRFYFPGPSVEVQEIDGCESIDGVNGYRDE